MNNTLSNKQINAVQEIIADVLAVAPSQVAAEARLKEDLGADSLHKVEIAMNLEEEFELSIPDMDWDAVSTVDDIYDAVAKLLDQMGEGRASTS